MINQEKLNMDFQNELNRLQEMMNLINSNQDPPIDLYDLKGSDEGDNKIDSLTMEPFDTFLIGDKSEVTSVYDDLECSMPLDSPPSPRLDVLGERKVDIDLPFGEHLDTSQWGIGKLTLILDIETNDLIPVPRVFDEPLEIPSGKVGHGDGK
ncbi:hypothetical protein Tco_0462724 [Tanacetum coccineum]